MTPMPSDAVIRFEPDGYDLRQPWLLGRHVAGHAFLRAAVAGRGEGPVYGYSAFQASAHRFAEMVAETDRKARTDWIKGTEFERIGQTRGVLYLADPSFTAHARLRLRAGPGAYSLCGVTHTLASTGTLQLVGELLSEAVMPWDALVCTSAAAVDAVRVVLQAHTDHLRWRFGPGIRIPTPQLPVIPLGVHCNDFDFTDADRRKARRALGIAPDEIAALYVGRLVYTGKAHPYPMFAGLQAAAERSGKKLALILCGRAPNDNIEAAYLDGAAQFAPDVRLVVVDSREEAQRSRAWAAGDLFMSLADGIQETFGLTPTEAMAAGLPVIVTDWNGYRDTVRDGVDGFRISTWAPQPGCGESYATRYEVGTLTYDRFCWGAAAATSVDLDQLVDRLTTLLEQPDLRRRMGEAGQARMREAFDWRHVYRQYQALWGELNARRLAATAEEQAWIAAAPRSAPSRLDPFTNFAHFPTSLITQRTQVSLRPDATIEAYRLRNDHALFPQAGVPEAIVAPMLSELQNGATTVTRLSAVGDVSPAWAIVVIGTLAKMGLVDLI